MARVSLVALVFAALVLTACSRQTLLIVTDQYWSASTLDSALMKRGLQNLSRERGVRVDTRTVPFGTAPMEKLIGILQGTTGRLVLLSPLYSRYASALAAHFHDRRFLSFGPAPPEPGLSNITYLVSDPSSAFASAAKRIAEYLASNHQPVQTEAQEVIGVFADNTTGQQSLAAFQKGFNAASAQASLSVVQFSGTADRSRLRSFLDGTRGRNVAVYLLAAPALDAYALDVLKNSTSPIVTLNWRYGATYSDKVLFSIDEDIPTAIMKILEPMGPAADNQIRIPWDIVTGAKGS